jgi:hypothetical protein
MIEAESSMSNEAGQPIDQLIISTLKRIVRIGG